MKYPNRPSILDLELAWATMGRFYGARIVALVLLSSPSLRRRKFDSPPAAASSSSSSMVLARLLKHLSFVAAVAHAVVLARG